MKVEGEACYRALCARDGRFDGVFFVGVATTGIYCRPICPARTPRRDRCHFFASRSGAEEAGFRPCLRCRPEHAPGRADTESLSRLARAAVEAIEAGFLDEQGLEALAARLTVSTRHLRRALHAELGVSPLALAQERRLALARSLVRDTQLPLTEVAGAAGYRSVRRFNDAFVRQMGRTPSSLRAASGAGPRRRGTRPPNAPDAGATLALRLDYRPPLPWELLLEHMRTRAVGGVEYVQGSRYARTVALGEIRGWWSLEPEAGRPTVRPALRLTVSVSLLPVLREIARRVRQQWDLDARPDVIEAHLRQFAVLKKGLAARSGLRMLGAWEAFEGSVRILLNQQNSVASAATLATRLVERAGLRMEGGPPGLTAFFPPAARLASWTEDEVAALGMPRRRAAALLSLARVWDAEALELPQLAGIGPWTRDLFALRVGRHPDTFPAEDLVLKRALGLEAKAARQAAEAWRPWRSYAAMHLWAEAAGRK